MLPILGVPGLRDNQSLPPPSCDCLPVSLSSYKDTKSYWIRTHPNDLQNKVTLARSRDWVLDISFGQGGGAQFNPGPTHPAQGLQFATSTSNASSWCNGRGLFQNPKWCPNRFLGGPEPPPTFHQSQPSASPEKSRLHRTPTVKAPLQLSGDARASVYLTDSCTGVRSRPRTKQALLNRQAAPRGTRDSPTQTLSQGFPMEKKHLVPNPSPATQPWLTLQTALRCPETSPARGQLIRAPI